MKLSVLIVTFNEEKRLKECLHPLRRFDEIIAIDLGSSDCSIEIVKKMGIHVRQHPWLSAVELVLPEAVNWAKNDWILRIDPDEVFPLNLVEELLALQVGDEFGMVAIPFQYYFKNKKLDTTVWGGIRPFPRIIHRNRVNITPSVHRGIRCKSGYQEFLLSTRPSNAVQHYWIDSYKQLWEKHWRYIKMEGEARYNEGKRFKVSYLLYETIKALYISMISKQGWRGGLTGIFLSLFYAWYNFMSVMSLAVYQFKQFRQKNG